jgi:prepilin-type N-terminal cleavage/methylation domain-containing protein
MIKRNGFTIIEALIVLAIIAAILGMSAPQFFRFTHGSTINSAASQISNILRTARSFAISRNRNYAVNFDNTIIPNVVWSTDSLNNIVGKRISLPKTVSITNITFLNDIATFKPTGGILGNSGSVTLIDSGGITKQITVINTTGRVKIN